MKQRKPDSPRKPEHRSTDSTQSEPNPNIDHRREEIERGLRLAAEYWLRIQPFIKERALRGAELYVASAAHLRLRQAARWAAEWNSTDYGRRFPVPAESLVDWGKEEFREPEELVRTENLTPELLASLAAQLMPKRKAKLSPTQAVVVSHELLFAAERYVRALPMQKRGIDRSIEELQTASSTVTVEEIAASNKQRSGQLPLLPPSAQKRKNVPEQEQREKPLSIRAIRVAIRRYLIERTPRMTQQEYDRDQEQTERLAKEGKLFRLGTGKPRTFQEWQAENQNAVDYFVQNRCISIQDLCELRWQRFEKSSQSQQGRAANRKLSGLR